ncbi:NACHT domain- and WD repeat-containing protein 1 [Sphaeramia orbicularis]|uniref:NACHT domain- and WD repeat-containing protein 1 n=1 Tax=Sphaeramia orbicularis TaxID=375764 RepID=UPI00118088C7|nr:NACHT domain- and WD repeat-containing protein 1-like [Sphaeramia orbicularis]
MEALVENSDEEKEEMEGKHKYTDDRTCLSNMSNTDDVEKTMGDKSLPMMSNLSDLMTKEIQEAEEPPLFLEKKRFMVYICGGYKDSVEERAALMENVYPLLYLYCKQRGYDFSMVDLRCSVRNPFSEHHDTVQLHVESLQRCQGTLGPNFFLFVGQKHEVQSLPSSLSKKTFEAILTVLEKEWVQMSKGKLVDEFSESGSQSSIATESSTGSFVHESIYGNYLNFGDEVTSSGLLSQGSFSSGSDGEEARLSPVGVRSLEDVEQDQTVLQMWYKLDENCIPPIYRLLPISFHLPGMLSVDRQDRKEARKDWRDTCQRLGAVLQHSAMEALGQEEASVLLRTVLDWEVETGLQTVAQAPPEDHCHCYKRVIPDLFYNLKNKHATHYADLLKGQAKLDPVLKTAQQRFMDRIHKKLRHTNIYERSVSWGRNGLDPKNNRSHQFYTERICSHVQRTIISSLNRVIKIPKIEGTFDVVRREVVRAQIHEEIQRHIDHGRHLWRKCTLRQAFLDDVQKTVEHSSCRPVLLLGPPGWGKSTVMAALAELAPTWIPGDVKVFIHFVGFTGESRNIRLVLQSLCVQLVEAYCPQTQLSEGFPQLVNEFYSLLGYVGAERPLVVLLDGLDELSEEHGSDLSWISTALPPHVHIILSATTDSACTQTLQTAHPIILSLPPLSVTEITAFLEAKLRADRRRLQEQQWQVLVQACESCPSPLYLEAAYGESLHWTSYSLQSSLSLPVSLEGLYLGLLTRLERDLGRQLVRRASTVISISLWGVTEEEMLHLLSKDEKVLQEVTSAHPAPSSSPRRVPYVLWVRLKRNLGLHLSEVYTDGTWVYRWTHSELGRVCIKNYFRTKASAMALHADYADYYRSKSQNAHIFQPLAWTLNEEEDGSGMAKIYRFNLRKLRGLPYHLVHSGQIIPFLTECLFNYEFLLHKVWGLSVLDIEEDLKKAVLPDKELVDVEVMSKTLGLSRIVLQQDPCQLASQLVGRLGQMIMEDRPLARGDPLKFRYLHALLAQCVHSSLPVLLPSSTCLLPPRDLQHTLLAGHLNTVTALGGGQSGVLAVTCEANGSLKFWDLEQRRIIKDLDPAGGFVGDSLNLGLEDQMVIVRMGHCLQVRDVESGNVVYSESDSIDVPILTTTCDGRLLVVFYDGTPLVKVFDLASSCSLLHSIKISMEHEPIHKDSSLLLSSNSIQDYVLFAYRFVSVHCHSVLSMLRSLLLVGEADIRLRLQVIVFHVKLTP